MIAELARRLRAVERILSNLRDFEAEVIENEDPEGLQRIKVKCQPIYGQEVSPWCISKEPWVGDGVGVVKTPPIGSRVSITLRGGNADNPQWEGGFRNSTSRPPSEFDNPAVNGEKTESGILIVKDDTDGSYKIVVPAGGTLHLTEDGEAVTIGVTRLNDGTVNIALGGPRIKCPVTGKDIPSSLSCFVKEN